MIIALIGIDGAMVDPSDTSTVLYAYLCFLRGRGRRHRLLRARKRRIQCSLSGLGPLMGRLDQCDDGCAAAAAMGRG